MGTYHLRWLRTRRAWCSGVPVHGLQCGPCSSPFSIRGMRPCASSASGLCQPSAGVSSLAACPALPHHECGSVCHTQSSALTTHMILDQHIVQRSSRPAGGFALAGLPSSDGIARRWLRRVGEMPLCWWNRVPPSSH